MSSSSFPFDCSAVVKKRPIRVAALQFACGWDVEANVAKATELVRQAAARGAQVILLQELFQRTYFCQWQKPEFFQFASSSVVAENPLLQHFQKLAKELQVVLPISFFEKSGNSFFNSMKVFDIDGTDLGLYRKSHIPDGPGYTEKYYFSPGDTGFRIFESKLVKLGVAICWDQWFSECARCMTLLGAELLFYPTAIGSEPHDANIQSHDHWETVQRGHAAANLVPVIVSNRIGREADITFYGGSFIADQHGQLLQKASKDQEEIITQDLDLQQVASVRAAWGIFRDRRPELYFPTIASLDGKKVHATIQQMTHLAATQSHQQTSSLPTFTSTSNLSSALVSPTAVALPSDPLLSTPVADGFLMPGEWETHKATWMLWPFRGDNWRAQAKYAQLAWVEVISAISQYEPVYVCVPMSQLSVAASLLAQVKNIHLVNMESSDAWARDSGPSFVKNMRTGEVRGVHWNFNAWGGAHSGCYDDWSLDLLVAANMLKQANVLRYRCPMILEGGSIHVDGQGTLLTTEECLLHPNRNPTMTREDIEIELKKYTGCCKIIWLKYGLYCDDDTNGHIDNMACFVRPSEVALAWTDDQTDPQYERSRLAYELLTASTDALGRPFKVHKITQPAQPLIMQEAEVKELEGIDEKELYDEKCERHIGKRLAASYINFYIANGAIIMPAFGDKNDNVAKEQLQALFPTRKIVQISRGRDILLGGGNIHCITQQQPL